MSYFLNTFSTGRLNGYLETVPWVRLAVFISMLLAMILTGCERPIDRSKQPGVITLSDAFLNEFELIDHHGLPAPSSRFIGKPSLIYYGFTTCPDVCPNALGVMTRALDELGTKAARFNFLFVTIDPERDTAAALKTYLAFDPRILGLTGTQEAAQRARENIKLFAQKIELPDSALGYTMDHQSFFYVIDKHGTPQLALVDHLAPGDIASVLKDYL